MVRIGINGLGRIGRCALKQAIDHGVEVVGVNDLADSGDLAYLFRHDSVHGSYPGKVEAHDSKLEIGDRTIPFLSEDRPGAIPWGDLGAEVVLECTGAFRSRLGAAGHLEAGAGRVVISAPSDDADVTVVPGVNQAAYDPDRHRVVSMASCTTNCVAPVVKVLHDAFGVEYGFFTTAHAYTSSQSLVDLPTRKRRRGRAAAVSMVPTTTGAAQATEQVIPALAGRLDGMAIRVPIPDGSVVDLVAGLAAEVDPEKVNAALRRAAASELSGILAVSDDDLVSIDIIGDPHSAIVDAASTRSLQGRVVKVLAWYDNEWGYATRLVDLATMIGG